jgi:threonine dehydratase
VRERGVEKVHCVIASTGNAALAAAWTCKRLGVRCAIFVPEGCPEALLDTLRSEGAEVQISGTVYPESLASAQEFMRNDPDA